MKKRIITGSALFMAFFLALVARIGYIALGESYKVAKTYNSYSLVLDKLEPNLYYSNYEKLTNNKTEKYALLKPNIKTLSELSDYGINRNEVEGELSQGKPVLKKINKAENGYIKTYDAKVSVNTASQLLSKESSGLLKYLPEAVGERRLRYYVDAKGRMLLGEKVEFADDNYVTSEGLLLTLNEGVQKIAYNASKKLKNGCVVIMDVETSKLLACVTQPDSSYVNKPLSLYPAGSVFKLVIAACALENGIDPLYNCNGKITVGDTSYTCQKLHKHNNQHIKEALANSCNCYFVNLANVLGAEKIAETAKKLGFEENARLYKNWEFKTALLPTVLEMKRGDLSLIGFGQGKLSVTPMQFCSLLCTVADKGIKKDIKLVEAEVDKYGSKTEIKYSEGERVMAENTCDLLIQYLRGVVENGTGKAADYDNKSAGKTATAQTGQFVNSREILNTWFIGVYPYDNPKYAIVIMKEDGSSGAEDCCPVFCTVVEKLSKL